MGAILRLTSDPARLYGYSPTLVIGDELAFWTTPNLRRAYAALTSVGGARSPPQTFAITTAAEAPTRHDSILGTLLDAALDEGTSSVNPVSPWRRCRPRRRCCGPTTRPPATRTTWPR